MHGYFRRIGRTPENLLFHPVEQFEALCRLRKQVNRSAEIDRIEVFQPFDHQRIAGHLTGQTHHFGMAPFAEDHHLAATLLHLAVCLDYDFLQMVRPRDRSHRSL